MTRGDLWWADFGVPSGSEPGFRRPILIVQDDDFNRSTIGTVIVLPLSTNLGLEAAPGNVFLDKGTTGLSKDSVAVVSQLYAVDRRRLSERISRLEPRLLEEIEDGLFLVLGIRKPR